MSIVDDLMDLFPDEITGQPGSLNTSGDFVPAGDPVTVPCRYEMEIRVFQRGTGQAKTSRMSVIVAGTPGFDPETWRFTIPSRYSPFENLQAVAVLPESDEDGAVYEELLLP